MPAQRAQLGGVLRSMPCGSGAELVRTRIGVTEGEEGVLSWEGFEEGKATRSTLSPNVILIRLPKGKAIGPEMCEES